MLFAFPPPPAARHRLKENGASLLQKPRLCRTHPADQAFTTNARARSAMRCAVRPNCS